MLKPPPKYRLPANKFPITVEALHPDTMAVVWSTRVEKPEEWAVLYIPPLARIHGHPIAIRMTFGDGEIISSPRT